MEDREGGEELEYLLEAAGGARRIDGPDQGFCLFTAGVALQSPLRSGGYEAEVRRVVSLGGDTDTNAAVAGALVGALVGEAGGHLRMATKSPGRGPRARRGRA